MRVCISYMHPYPIKSLNHTLLFRICKLCFQANMQVTSTLWPGIKSQKLSEHRFGLRWTKSDARTHAKTRQDKANPSIQTKGGPIQPVGRRWGRLAARVGRPTYLVGRPGPWAPLPQLRHMSSPHWLPMAVLQASPRGSLL